MFTMQQILKLYEEGVDVVFEERPDISNQKGEWDVFSLEVIVFLSTARSKRDRLLTILHELRHAAEDLLGFKRLGDGQIEKLADETYDTNPYIIQFVRQLYPSRHI